MTILRVTVKISVMYFLVAFKDHCLIRLLQGEKNEKKPILIVLAGFATVVQAAPQDDTWYTGGKLDWSQYHDTVFYSNDFDNRLCNGSSRDDQLGVGVFDGVIRGTNILVLR